MPNIQKINDNKAQFLANLQEIAKLINAVMSTTPVDITNQEIDCAMLGTESAYKANLESLPDEDYEYKQKQKDNIKHICHYIGEFYKEANTYQQRKNQELTRRKK